MGKLFSIAMSPIAMLWSLCETYIWPSMALFTVAAAVLWASSLPIYGMFAAFAVAILLMRADPLAEAKAARAAATTG
ncbi:hypothetical protein [Falsiroseomonas oryzae]|uniref:hypothetical protein n=1 Tax=Falsiroseomonas oryzae TaxID=2766473 RepID=UPI0022EA6706|nr:hypothetical protein [Roseomonas sp. MO-31]